jgi:signal peptide peptidase SppA
MNNPRIGAIVIDVNSPGGTVFGLTAITDKIFNARGKKPIIAVTNSLMASAAYFIASAADEIIADPDSLTGCVGTISVHLEYSKFLEDAGITPSIFSAGKFKAEGNQFTPLTDEARAEFQKAVDDYAATFYAAVARNRNVTVTKVKADFGQGRVLRAEAAKAVNMIDRIPTLQSVIERLQSTSAASSNSRTKAKLTAAQAKVKVHEMNT